MKQFILLIFIGISIGLNAQSTYIQGVNSYNTKDLFPGQSTFSSFTSTGSRIYANKGDSIYVLLPQEDSILHVFSTDTSYRSFPGAMEYDEKSQSLYVTNTVTGNTDDRLMQYHFPTQTWKHITTLAGMFDIELWREHILISGLNSADFSTKNSIWLLDTLHNIQHQLIKLDGSSGPLVSDLEDNLIYITSRWEADNYILRWEASKVQTSIDNLQPLTIMDADTLAMLPAGAFSCDIDDTGNLIFTCNDFNNKNFVGLWNGDIGSGKNYIELATSDEFLTFCPIHGNIRQDEPGNFGMTMGYGKPISAYFLPSVDDAPIKIQDFTYLATTQHHYSVSYQLDTYFSDEDSEIVYEASFAEGKKGGFSAVIDSNVLTVSHDTYVGEKVALEITATSNGISTSDTLLLRDFTTQDKNVSFILNEGWFGHDKGSLTMLTKDPEFPSVYNVFQHVHNDTLGATGTYISTYGGNYIITTKGSPSLLVMGQEDLTIKFILDTLKNSSGEVLQPNAIAGSIYPHAIVTTSNGAFPINLETGELQEMLDGTEGVCDQAILSNDYIYIAKPDKIIILNLSHEIVKEIATESTSFLTSQDDGKVFFADRQVIYEISDNGSPKILAVIPDSIALPSISSWYSPNKVHAHENALYIAPSDANYLRTRVYKLNITDTVSLVETIISLDSSLTLYGQGINLKQHNGETTIVATTVQSGYGNNYRKNNQIIEYALNGDILTRTRLEDYFWFPSMTTQRYISELEIIAEFDNIQLLGVDSVIRVRNSITDLHAMDGEIIIRVDDFDGQDLDVTEDSGAIKISKKGNFTSTEIQCTIFLHGVPHEITIIVNDLINATAEDNHHIFIHPNPAVDYIILDDSEKSIQEATLYNMNGVIVKQFKNIHSVMDISSLVPGVYQMELRTKNGETRSHRIIKN